jgi:hypothetical protein
MKNLRSYVESNSRQEQSAAELTKKIASAYDGQSGAGMWLQILSEAEKAKRAGRLSNDEIDEFYAQFAPMLNAAQKKQLGDVVQKLKEI